jgi:UTP--glucose-1-phosphate uridylyltransferase
MTKRDAQKQLEKELDNLLKTSDEKKRAGIQKEMAGFASLFDRFLQEDGPSVEWEKIQKLPEEAVKDYAGLNEPNEQEIKKMLDKLVVVKLNGGLGTSMGCHGPKSVIPVRSDLTFLDLTVQQIEVSDFIHQSLLTRFLTFET